MLSPAQTLTAGYRYDPFGRTLGSVGTQASANPMRFSSKPLLVDRSSESLSLYYYGYRFYEPQIQRWPNRDPLGEPGFEVFRQGVINPLGDGPNRYSFLDNDPVNFVDVVGLEKLCCEGFESQWESPPWYARFPILKLMSCMTAKTACQAKCEKYTDTEHSEGKSKDCLDMCIEDCESRWRICLGATAPRKQPPL
jgi:RHS repeat-associated protein